MRRPAVTNPFSWDYLTAPIARTPTFGPFSTFYLALFAITLVISLYLGNVAHKRWADFKPMRDLVQRASSWLGWVTGLGLIAFGVRALRFPFLTLELRLWLYLAFLAYLGVVGYMLYYYRTTYTAEVAELEKRRERRKYHLETGGRAKRSSQRARPNRQARG
jgi:hypothetical protein